MWLQPTDVKSAKLGEAEMVEYLIPEVHGKPIEQKNVFACLAEDGFFADIHVSKVQFKPDEESLLISIIKAAHFKVTSAPELSVASLGSSRVSRPSPGTSSYYYNWGCRYYLERQFRKAIDSYEKALDLEKKEPKLNQTQWRVLVDNLGMAYGLARDLKRAQETFE